MFVEVLIVVEFYNVVEVVKGVQEEIRQEVR